MARRSSVTVNLDAQTISALRRTGLAETRSVSAQARHYIRAGLVRDGAVAADAPSPVDNVED